MAKKHQFKFLSQSVLLEESGLPRINTLVIITITILLIGFITWSNYVDIEEQLSANGQIILSDEGVYKVIGHLNANDIVKIDEDYRVYISVPGITSKEDLKGNLENILIKPRYTDSGEVYYEFVITFDSAKYSNDSDTNPLLVGMNCRLNIVTGSKTMLQYLLGNLYDTGRSTFDLK